MLLDAFRPAALRVRAEVVVPVDGAADVLDEFERFGSPTASIECCSMPSVPVEDEFNGLCIEDDHIKLTSYPNVRVTPYPRAPRQTSLQHSKGLYHRCEAILMSC